MTELHLSRDEARWIATIAQGLDRRPFSRRVRTADILDVFDRLGCIQLDTISVISRSHETVLWSRLGAFDPQLVVDLYDPALQLTEYWAHAAAIVPVSMLPLFRHAMEAFAADWGNRDPDPVLARVRASGPISSRDFEAPDGMPRAEAWAWYGNKIERQALYALWTSGRLLIRKRERSFARVYDLAERVAPDLWSGDTLSTEYRQRALLTRAIRALGVFTADWASDYFRSGRRIHLNMKETRRLLAQLEREGRILPVDVPGVKDAIWLDANRRETLELLREGKGRPTLTTLLSPFDNLVWNRNRDLQLWDFDYRLECYTPAPKRIYGYYTLPILHRGRLIGRLEPSYDRKARVLTIRNLHFEGRLKITPPIASAVMRSIEDLLGFLGGPPGAWRVEQTRPEDAHALFQVGAE